MSMEGIGGVGSGTGVSKGILPVLWVVESQDGSRVDLTLSLGGHHGLSLLFSTHPSVSPSVQLGQCDAPHP
jgi:hypothetical protein